jgi:hypothetical protein
MGNSSYQAPQSSHLLAIHKLSLRYAQLLQQLSQFDIP